MIRTNVCVFIVLLCSIPFSRLGAYSYGERVSASNSSAIFSLCMCAVNMSQNHSSSQSPQSVLDASSSLFLMPLRPMVLNYAKRPRPFRHRFSHLTNLSWSQTSLFFCASASPLFQLPKLVLLDRRVQVCLVINFKLRSRPLQILPFRQSRPTWTILMANPLELFPKMD